MGCVDGNWSCRYATVLKSWAKVVQAFVQRVASARASVPGEGGEGLVQPQVVPPAHGDQVAEPHVGHLVHDRLRACLSIRVGDPRPEHVLFDEGHAADVLHRAHVELRHKELVVLAERVPDPERLMEEGEALLGHLEDLVGIEVLGKRPATVHAEWDPVERVTYLARTGRRKPR